MVHPAQFARSRMTDTEERLARELPGWSCWPIGTWDGRTLWNAGPLGPTGNSTSAIINDVPSPDELVKRVRAYEAELPQHIAEVRRRMAAVPDTGYGRDQAAVFKARVADLEQLLAAREAKAAAEAEDAENAKAE